MCKYFSILPIILFLIFMFFAGNNFYCKPDVNEFYVYNGRYLRTIEYEKHTYIHLVNKWSGAGDRFIHNPECQCQKGK